MVEQTVAPGCFQPRSYVPVSCLRVPAAAAVAASWLAAVWQETPASTRYDRVSLQTDVCQHCLLALHNQSQTMIIHRSGQQYDDNYM